MISDTDKLESVDKQMTRVDTLETMQNHFLEMLQKHSPVLVCFFRPYYLALHTILLFRESDITMQFPEKNENENMPTLYENVPSTVFKVLGRIIVLRVCV